MAGCQLSPAALSSEMAEMLTVWLNGPASHSAGQMHMQACSCLVKSAHNAIEERNMSALSSG